LNITFFKPLAEWMSDGNTDLFGTEIWKILVPMVSCLLRLCQIRFAGSSVDGDLGFADMERKACKVNGRCTASLGACVVSYRWCLLLISIHGFDGGRIAWC
jgi:hypothetical protein